MNGFAMDLYKPVKVGALQEELRQVREQLQREQLQLLAEQSRLSDLAYKLADANKLRDELLDALEGVMYWDNGKPEWEIARAAIAKVKGGAA